MAFNDYKELLIDNIKIEKTVQNTLNEKNYTIKYSKNNNKVTLNYQNNNKYLELWFLNFINYNKI